MTCSVTSASAMSATSALTRSETVPSISPIRSGSRLPRSTTPGSITSAPVLTKDSTTRSGPTTAASCSAFRPFCSETTKPSPCSLPARLAAAAAVCCDLTATRTGPSSRSGRSAGSTAGTRTVKFSTGPSIRRPFSLTAATTAGSASLTSTSWPSRTSPAATVPPIAPQPSTT